LIIVDDVSTEEDPDFHVGVARLQKQVSDPDRVAEFLHLLERTPSAPKNPVTMRYETEVRLFFDLDVVGDEREGAVNDREKHAHEDEHDENDVDDDEDGAEHGEDRTRALVVQVPEHHFHELREAARERAVALQRVPEQKVGHLDERPHNHRKRDRKHGDVLETRPERYFQMFHQVEVEEPATWSARAPVSNELHMHFMVL